jgi:hypothetical protein
VLSGSSSGGSGSTADVGTVGGSPVPWVRDGAAGKLGGGGGGGSGVRVGIGGGA